MTRTTILILSLLCIAAPASAQNPGPLRVSEMTTPSARSTEVGCQSRVLQFDDWAHAGTWTLGPGLIFDYPAVASQVEIESLSAQVLTFDALTRLYTPNGTTAQTQTGFINLKPDGLLVDAWYQSSPTHDFVVSRPFKGANHIDETLNRFLVPRASWYAVAYSTYPADVRVRWTMPVIVC